MRGREEGGGRGEGKEGGRVAGRRRQAEGGRRKSGGPLPKGGAGWAQSSENTVRPTPRALRPSTTEGGVAVLPNKGAPCTPQLVRGHNDDLHVSSLRGTSGSPPWQAGWGWGGGERELGVTGGAGFLPHRVYVRTWSRAAQRLKSQTPTRQPAGLGGQSGYRGPLTRTPGKGSFFYMNFWGVRPNQARESLIASLTSAVQFRALSVQQL